MSESSIETPGLPARVLVAVELPLDEPFPEALAETLAASEIFVLAYRIVPDQTSPEQAEANFGEEDEAALEETTATFEDYGRGVDSELVYTSNATETIHRYEHELEVDATLYGHPVEQVERVLAVGTESIDFDRFVACLSSVGRAPLHLLKLLQIGSDERELDEQELVLEGIKSRLADRGVAEEIVLTQSIVPAQETEEVLEAAEGFDLVVVAASRPSLGEQLLGTLAERVRNQAELSVLFVRAPDD